MRTVGNETAPRVYDEVFMDERNPRKLIHQMPEPIHNGMNELSSALGRMAATISVLNTLLQEERSKTSALLLENFCLKSRSQELELKLSLPQNNSDASATKKPFEFRSKLITAAERQDNDSKKAIVLQRTQQRDTKGRKEQQCE